MVTRIAAQPGGHDQIERMRALGELALRTREPRLGRIAAALCGVAFLFQVGFAPDVEITGMFNAALVSMGEGWRLVTANLLHAGIAHLAMNALGLVVIGGLVERSLGVAGTGFTMGLSAIGAMAGSWIAGYEWAVGASGVVMGLVGALLLLEFRYPDELPAAWRLPRRIFVGVILLEIVIGQHLAFIAQAAHLGGLAAGAVAASVVGPALPPHARTGSRIGLTLANAILAVWFIAGLAQGIQLSLAPGADARVRRAGVLLGLEDLSPWILNNEAWRIATSEAPDPGELAAALALAERAVARTLRRDPNLLDTLAEVHFAAGRPDVAVAVIDEAIALATGEPYFLEQRRRYLGERDAEDRPDPPPPFTPGEPQGPLLPPGHPPLDAPEDSPGVRV